MCIKRTFNRYILYSAILTTLLLCALTYTDYVKKHFPEHIYITEQSNTTFNLSVPVTGNVETAERDHAEVAMGVYEAWDHDSALRVDLLEGLASF